MQVSDKSTYSGPHEPHLNPPSPCLCMFILSGPRSRNLAAWISGWFNLLGQVAATAGVAYTSSMLIADFVFLCTGGAHGGGFASDLPLKYAWYAGVLVVLGLINTLTVKALGIMGEVSGGVGWGRGY